MIYISVYYIIITQSTCICPSPTGSFPETACVSNTFMAQDPMSIPIPFAGNLHPLLQDL